MTSGLRICKLETRLGVFVQNISLVEREVDAYTGLVQALAVEGSGQELEESELADPHTCRLYAENIVNYLFRSRKGLEFVYPRDFSAHPNCERK